MRRPPALLLAAGGLLLAAGVPGALAAPARSPTAPAPAGLSLAATPLEPTPCPVPVREGVHVECGLLVVPESRERPDGSSIRLLVAVAPSATPPQHPPLLVTAGGPGSSSEGLLGLAGSGYAQGRDLVVLEQRGTRHSRPTLDCPEVQQALVATLRTADPVEQETAREVAAGRACAQRLRAEGVDLSAYTTAENAADVADLRRALGVPQWDLWGLSYSTRLVLTVLRDHPEGVRSAVLDSVVPVDGRPYGRQVGALAEAYRRLAEDCAATAACARAHPDLATALPEVAARLDRQPLPVDAVHPDTGEAVRLHLTGDDAVSAVFTSLYDPATTRYVPLLLDRLAARDAAAAAPLVDAALAELTGPALGLYYSINCSEAAPRTDPGVAAADAGALPGRARTHLLWLGSDLEVCRGWGVPPRPDSAAPVRSDVPVLVVAGRYDPVTPPAEGRQVAAELARATFVEVPGEGHTPSLRGDCVPGVVQAFLAEPDRPPDTGCVARMPGPDLVDGAQLQLTGGVYRLARDAQHGPHVLPGLGLAALAGLLVALVGLVRALLRRGRSWPLVTATAVAVADLGAVAGLGLLAAGSAARDPVALGFGLPGAGGLLLAVPVVAAGAALVAASAGRARRQPEVLLAAAAATLLLAVCAVVDLLPG